MSVDIFYVCTVSNSALHILQIREASVTICSVHLPISPSNDTATIADDAQATDQQSVIVRIGTALHAKLASVKDVIVMGDFGLSSDVPGTSR